METAEFKTRLEDAVLPIIQLPNPCPVEVMVTEKYVFLHVGQRDWQWDRVTGKLVGAGTAIPE